MLFYHGTLLRHAQNIMKAGVIAETNKRYELDFGYGFYMSKSRKFAKYHANELSKKGDEKDILNTPVIIEVDLDLPYLLKHYTYRRFLWKSPSFLKYVFTCRCNCDEPEHPCFKDDIVIGPMADGNLTDSISYYKMKQNIFRKMVVYLNFLLPHPKYCTQVLLRNQEICDMIGLRKITNMKGDIL